MGVYRDRILPWLLDQGSGIAALRGLRQEQVSPCRGEVLEIGLGSGHNLPFYRTGPEGVDRLVGLEPSRAMTRRAAARIAAAPVRPEIVHAPAEVMPFGDESFDFVVSSLTLCSVTDALAAVEEVHRVLRPSGRFLFLEHGEAQTERGRRWQRRLDPFQRYFVGCRLDLPIASIVKSSGLRVARIERFGLPRAPEFLGSMYRGAAVRDA